MLGPSSVTELSFMCYLTLCKLLLLQLLLLPGCSGCCFQDVPHSRQVHYHGTIYFQLCSPCCPGLICRPGWSQVHRDPLASASIVLQLKTWATTTPQPAIFSVLTSVSLKSTLHESQTRTSSFLEILANERLRALEDIEREIGAILQNAGTAILELSKEKTNERLLDRQAAAFTASVQHVEAELSAQIRYLTQVATGQPHEGSSYSSRKDCQMALKRVDYARLKISDVARTCEQMLES